FLFRTRLARFSHFQHGIAKPIEHDCRPAAPSREGLSKVSGALSLTDTFVSRQVRSTQGVKGEVLGQKPNRKRNAAANQPGTIVQSKTPVNTCGNPPDNLSTSRSLPCMKIQQYLHNCWSK